NLISINCCNSCVMCFPIWDSNAWSPCPPPLFPSMFLADLFFALFSVLFSFASHLILRKFDLYMINFGSLPFSLIWGFSYFNWDFKRLFRDKKSSGFKENVMICRILFMDFL
ncbi:unnamed protein product, partial [Prunus brigantina]